MDLIRFDVTDTEVFCEFYKQGLTHTPGMLYYSSSGKLVKKTEVFMAMDQLRFELDSLQTQP